MARIYIDNKPYEVSDGQNLLHACLSLGFNIPYFCWHPAMHSVGACRQCAVKVYRDENDTKGRITMSCMTPATDGTRLSVDDPEAKAFRTNVIEWLMSNHPHDCPVCDEGGECHLQDMTVLAGQVYRRFRFKKRTYKNQYLGPLLNHEMNRCIQCYRCVRFYRDYSGGRDLDVFASHNNVYFGRHEDGVLESEFAGNLAEVCPTGVFTDKTFKNHYARKWDLQTAPSVCVHCGVGCNTIPGERYGELRRVRNRYNGEVNRYFLCDRGRYGYEFVNSDKRFRQPIIKTSEGGRAVASEEAMGKIADILRSGSNIIGIGSPRASIEANYALRALVGNNNFYTGMSDKDNRLVSLIIDILKNGPARSPSLKEIEAADAVLILGEDVTNTAPVLALALRQSARNKPRETALKLKIPFWDDSAVRNAVQNIKAPFYVAAPYSTKLEDVAAHVYHAAPQDIARLGFAVARELDAGAPPVENLPDEVLRVARTIAKSLKEAKNPLIVSGAGCGSEAVIQAAANIAWALSRIGLNANLSYAVPECNSMGAAFIKGGSMLDAFRISEESEIDTAIILENDLYRRADRSMVDNFFKNIKHVITIDSILNPSSSIAEVALPAATYAEADGTLINNEGRAQRFYQVFVPEGEIREGWRWLKGVMDNLGLDYARKWDTTDDVLKAFVNEFPDLSGVTEAAPSGDFRIQGMRIARQPHRYSGRTAISADKTVFVPKPPEDPDSPFSFSMEGFQGKPPSPLIPRFWTPGWNSPQALTKFQTEAGGPLIGGNPGQRLIEGKETGRPFYSLVPNPFRARKNEWLLVNSFHIFGSDELSRYAPAIDELTPKPYIGLNFEDAANLRVEAGEELSVKIGGIEFFLPVRHLSGLPKGVAALPLLPEALKTGLPAWGIIAKAERKIA